MRGTSSIFSVVIRDVVALVCVVVAAVDCCPDVVVVEVELVVVEVVVDDVD